MEGELREFLRKESGKDFLWNNVRIGRGEDSKLQGRNKKKKKKVIEKKRKRKRGGSQKRIFLACILDLKKMEKKKKKEKKKRKETGVHRFFGGFWGSRTYLA